MPKGVTVKVARRRGRGEGAEGQADQAFPPGINFELADGQLVAKRSTDDPALGKFHGLARSLVANAVTGVTDGFKRELDIVGVGYRAEVKGKQVIFALGYSHPVVFDIPTGIDIAIDKQTHITVTGVDRQLVGQVAANIRRLRKPDPVQAEGRPLHRRSAEEEGRQDRGEIGRLGLSVWRGHGPDRSQSEPEHDYEDQDQGRSPRADSAAAAQADCRHPGAAAPERVPQRVAHLRAGDRRPERPDAGVGLERRAGAEGRVRQGRQRRQHEGRRSDRQGDRRAVDRKGHQARGLRSRRLPVSRAHSRAWRTRRAKQDWSSRVQHANSRDESIRRSSTSRTPSSRSTA